jgi:Ca2+-binding EF-hand superfamily protein
MLPTRKILVPAEIHIPHAMTLRSLKICGGCLVLAALPPLFAGDAGGLLKQMDTNGDNRITLAEYIAEVHVRFDKLDANRDGVIAADELYSQEPRRSGRMRTGVRAENGNLAVSAKLGPADQNSDGQITRAENDVDAEAHFAAMDTDKDGVLTEYELDTARR